MNSRSIGRSSNAIAFRYMPIENSFLIFVGIVSIRGLNFLSGPSAITRFITFVSVNSIYRQNLSIAVLFSPIFKIGKIFPLIADLDPFSTIVFPALKIMINASLMHCLPYIIKFCSSPPMFNRSHSNKLAATRFARFNFLKPKIAASREKLSPAFTNTKPYGSAPFCISRLPYNRNFTKLESGHIF